jgi:glycosyltransferase involved in cell wall biosynthesis
MTFQLFFRKFLKYHQPGFFKYLDYIIFDFIATFFVKNNHILIGFAGVTLFSGKKTISKGGMYFLDRACPFFNFQYNLIKNDYEKFGLPIPIVPKYLTNRLLEEYLVSNYIIVPSDYSKNSYPDFLTKKIIKQKIFINTFLSNEISPLFTKHNNKFYVGFIGGDFIRKGVGYIIETFEILFNVNKDIVLVIKMHPNEFKKTKEANDFISKFTNRIIFINYLKNIKSFYEHIDYLILPSIDEGFGMVVLESILCSKPVIVSSNVGSSEYLKNSKYSYVFKVKDNKEFIQCLSKAYNNFTDINTNDIKLDCKHIYDNYLNTSSSLLKYI